MIQKLLDGQPFVKQANGSLTVPVGTYNYVLVATLDIIPTATSGAVTASIIPLQ